MADQGTGITFDDGTGYYTEITSLALGGVDRPPVDTTTYGVSNGMRTFVPSDVGNPGQLTVGLRFDPASLPSIYTQGGVVTGTVTWSDAAGTAWAWDSFMSGFSVDTALEQDNAAEAVLQLSGVPVPTP